MFYVIILVIIAIGIVIALKYGRQTPKTKRYYLLVNYILTVAATFGGVFLALQLQSLYQENLVRQQEEFDKGLLVASIQLSVAEIDDQILHLRTFSTFLKEKQDEQEAKSILDANPIEDVIILDILITNPSFPGYCSSIGAGTIISFTKSKEKWLEVANRPTATLDGNFTGFEIYTEYLEDLKMLLLTEIDYIHGEISETEVLYKLDSLNLMSVNYEESNKELIAPVEIPSSNWFLIGGIIAAVAIIGGIIGLVIKRRTV